MQTNQNILKANSLAMKVVFLMLPSEAAILPALTTEETILTTSSISSVGIRSFALAVAITSAALENLQDSELIQNSRTVCTPAGADGSWLSLISSHYLPFKCDSPTSKPNHINQGVWGLGFGVWGLGFGEIGRASCRGRV